MTPPPVPASAADREITIAPDVRIPLLGLGVWQLVEGAEGERAIVSRARGRVPAHRHGAGLRERGDRRRRRARERHPARGDLRDHEVLSGPRRFGGRGGAQRRAARSRAHRPLPRARSAARSALGMARDASARSSAASRARSASATSPRGSGRAARGRETSRPPSTRSSSTPSRYRRATASRRARSAASRSRPTARSRAGGTSATPAVARVAERAGPHAGAGDAALGHRARLHRAAEVEPARAAGRERRDLRLRARRRRSSPSSTHSTARAAPSVPSSSPGGSALAGEHLRQQRRRAREARLEVVLRQGAVADHDAVAGARPAA